MNTLHKKQKNKKQHSSNNNNTNILKVEKTTITLKHMNPYIKQYHHSVNFKTETNSLCYIYENLFQQQ